MFLSMGVLGACMYCKEYNIMFPGITIIPLICLTMYMLAFGAGKEKIISNVFKEKQSTFRHFLSYTFI